MSIRSKTNEPSMEILSVTQKHCLTKESLVIRRRGECHGKDNQQFDAQIT